MKKLFTAKFTIAILYLIGASLFITSCSDNEDLLPLKATEISGDQTGELQVLLTIDKIERAEAYRWYRESELVQESDSREYTATEDGIYTVAGINTHGEGKASPGKKVTIIKEFNILTEKHIPDENFRQWVDEYLADNKGYYTNIQASNYRGAIDLIIREVSSLEGLGFFKSMKALWLSFSDITSIHLKDYINLEQIYLEHMYLLENIVLENCGKINRLSIHNANVKNIDLSTNENLRILSIYGTPLTSIKLGHKPKLEQLRLSKTELTQVEVDNLPELIEIRVDYGLVKNLSSINCPKLESIMCEYNNLSRIDISTNTRLQLLWCDGNPLEQIKVWPSFDIDNPPLRTYWIPEGARFVHEFE